jgi:peptide/nickel transport system substrate-binding protein
VNARLGRTAAAAVLAGLGVGLVASAQPAAATRSSASPAVGGVYRVGWEGGFGFTDGFDPTGEYRGEAAVIYTNLLVRTLVGYDHVAGVDGDRLVPDLAVSVPRPTHGGTTYTFHLKRGIHFGPPVARPVTSADIRYAFERLAKPEDGAEYPFYYTVIRGFAAFGAGKAKTISGISTPDDRTIVFRLTRPTGDFLYRLAMPATAPIPHEVAGCFDGQPGRYGHDLVSTGPYMIAGADEVDASSCSALKPMRGFDETTLDLVRNPDYDASTDSKTARESLPDEFRFEVDSSATDILDRVARGDLDDEIATPIPPQVLEQYATRRSLGRYLHLDAGDTTMFVTMNLTQPPFDDIHVRRAMSWILDKADIRRTWGGTTAGAIANHIVPDALLGGRLARYAPYKTPGDRGSLAAAKASMRGSKYDERGDGTCNASACKHVLLLTDTNAVFTRMLPALEASAARIGITFTVRRVSGAYPVLLTTARNIPIADFLGWGKDYPDPLTYLTPFDSRNIAPTGNNDVSLVGVTPAVARKDGITGSVAGVPSVDARLDRCARLSGAPRLTCYAGVDKYLMTQVVPWIPYLAPAAVDIVGPKVTRWGFDQSTGEPAFAHAAVEQ